MPRLLLINGLPGSGKSTLARRYVEDRPLALCLDIDVVRELVGGWFEQPGDSGRLARRIALAMAREVLAEGHDVVVPQFLARSAFVEELDALAGGCDVPFVEVALVQSVDGATARLETRAAGPMTATQRENHRLLDRDGGLARIPALHAGLSPVLDRRPGTIRIEPVPGDVAGTYRALVEALGR